MPKNLSELFFPKSIAVIGASRAKEKVGSIVLKNIIESKFKGNIYPVNPNTKNILKKKCYKSVYDLPEVVDLAIIATPAHTVLEILNQIGEKKIKNVVILSAGFKESGSDGVKLEKEMEDISNKYEINLLGPNCLGFVNKECPVNATFGKVSPQIGNISFITQSGAIATSLFDWCSSVNLGFSEFITLGNKTVLNETDVLEYLYNKSHNTITSLSDDSSKGKPIGLYLESISDGFGFMKICKQITKHDPIFILKPGKTKAASTAMQSHTGAIAGADDVLDVALIQAGVLRCETLEDFFDLSKAFSWSSLPKGPRVAVISNAGGPAVVSADSIIKEGLEIAEFDEETKKKLSEVLPRSASIVNPVDVLGDALADRFASAAEIVLQTDKCDSLVVILTPQIMTQIGKTAEMIGNISKKYDKPVFCSFIGGGAVSEGENILNNLNIPSFRFPERAIYAIGSMWKFKKQQEINEKNLVDVYQVLNFDLVSEKTQEIIKNAIKNNQKNLDNLDSNELVLNTDINTPETSVVNNLDESLSFTKENGYPVVLKISSPNLLHKKNVGGIALNIGNDRDLKSAWKSMEETIKNLDESVKGGVKIQIQKQVDEGIEVIVGVKKDSTFGNVMLFGAGGSFAELISDKNLSLFPIDTDRAKKLVLESKVSKLFEFKDGKSSYPLEKLYDLIIKLSKLVETIPEIEEMEINPVIVTKEDVWAVDTKVVLKENKQMSSGPKLRHAKTLSTELLVNKTRYFEFETDEPLNALPGQYITVKVSDTRMNCYSVAGQSSPTKFNLLVDSTPGGPGSVFFENLKAGDEITFMGPLGSFILKPDENVDSLLFLSTGCGFAPLKFMIETALHDERFNQKVKLYFGFNNYEDIFFKDYFEKLAKEHNNFDLEIAVNNPNPEWKGATGFVTELVKKDYPDASKCAAYLCGNKMMVENVSKLLTENGCSGDRVYSEKYGI